MATDWFATTSGASLEQGDVLADCPVYRVEAVTSADEDAEVIVERFDVVILTQSCDLENDKVEDVLVARLISYSDLCASEGPSSQVRSTAFRKAAVDGNLPAYFLLPSRAQEPGFAWSLVDFHNLFSIPKKLLEDVASGRGERLRLVPPYKEHMAQAFARYMMRVGLPTTLHDFAKFSPDASATA